jgi:chloramphenicol 3-O-phosphotransferase
MANPAWFFTPGMPTPMREELHEQILQDCHDRLEGDVGHDRRAIVLAGPPGAGKSCILNEVIGAPGSDQRSQWLEIDPDEIKTLLLDAATQDGSYETFIKPPAVRELEAQGERFFPLDFAALVHEESSTPAKIAREEAIRTGANVVIDSVLSNPAAAVELGRTLERAGYTVEVVDVEVPYELSQTRIAQRWSGAYTQALEGDPVHRHGGRWVPENYARSVYAGDGLRALSQESATALATSCPAVMRYRRYWTEAENSPMRVETDKGRFQRGGDLVDHSLITARTRSATSFGTSTRPTPHRGAARGPQNERE